MKSSLWLAVSLFSLALNTACGQIEDSESETLGATSCQITPNCRQDLPKLGRASGFNSLSKRLMYFGRGNHRARDILAVPGQDITLHAKFSYGLFDKDLKGEKVDIYLSSGCTSPLKKIGSVVTSQEGEHASMENVDDSGGRIFANLADLGVKNLPVGRHRVVYVVKGDHSLTESYINVIAPSDKVVLSDIDGTLTKSEMAAATEIIGIQPPAHAGAAEALTALRSRGYQIFYLTARPEWLMPHTRAWLKAKGFPAGTIHTTDSPTGAQGDAAKAYKKAEIALLHEQTGIVPSFAFGNKPSDVEAFGLGNIAVKNSYYFNLEGDPQGGIVHKNYKNLVSGFQKLPVACK